MTRRIAVVVPVHNEEELLPLCLESLATAARATAVPVDVVVVLDSCSDDSGSARIDRSAFASVQFIRVDARNVGSARRAGFAAVVGGSTSELWLATTDADSRVPTDWFTRQLRHRARGADVVVGTVAVSDWSGSPVDVRRRYLLAYTAGDGHRHVHGANLSFTARSYASVGGFQALPCDEDVRLVADLARAGHRLRWAGDLAVDTSARLSARAPNGFGAHLAELTDLASPVALRGIA